MSAERESFAKPGVTEALARGPIDCPMWRAKGDAVRHERTAVIERPGSPHEFVAESGGIRFYRGLRY